MKGKSPSLLLFHPRKSRGLLYLSVPLAYILLVRGFSSYWLQNDLRHLYKEILKPYYRRVDDALCPDARDFKTELYTNRVDPAKSTVVKLRQNVERKVQHSKTHTEEKGDV